MKRMRRLPVVAALAVMVLSIPSCSTVPLTGRHQLNLIPEPQMLSLSNDQYGQFLKENKLSNDAAATAMVKKVGANIAHGVEAYLTQSGHADLIKGYNWEFNLVQSDEVNAWCMPGGKVVVYTGILPLTENESGLAVVLGHEISHAVAQHGNERMSQQLLAQFGGAALSEILSSKPAATQQAFMTAFGVGTQVGVLLPFSRTQESEADHLGLIFMAMAGYNPQQALSFWQRMAAKSQGNAPPAFLSDHPSDQARIDKIKQEIPEAAKYYHGA